MELSSPVQILVHLDVVDKFNVTRLRGVLL